MTEAVVDISAGIEAVRGSLMQHGSATVFDPADSFPAFAIMVARGVLVVHRDEGALGVFGSVKAAVRFGRKGPK